MDQNHNFREKILSRWAGWSVENWGKALLIALVITVLLGFGMARLKMEMTFYSMLPDKSNQVRDLKEAAMHYYREKWTPVKPISDDMLRAMEVELRNHQGLKREGIDIPNGEFLESRTISSDYIMPGVDTSDKKVKDEVSAETIEAYKQKLLGRS